MGRLGDMYLDLFWTDMIMEAVRHYLVISIVTYFERKYVDNADLKTVETLSAFCLHFYLLE